MQKLVVKKFPLNNYKISLFRVFAATLSCLERALFASDAVAVDPRAFQPTWHHGAKMVSSFWNFLAWFEPGFWGFIVNGVKIVSNFRQMRIFRSIWIFPTFSGINPHSKAVSVILSPSQIRSTYWHQTENLRNQSKSSKSTGRFLIFLKILR